MIFNKFSITEDRKLLTQEVLNQFLTKLKHITLEDENQSEIFN